jgi:hypothetical protein
MHMRPRATATAVFLASTIVISTGCKQSALPGPKLEVQKAAVKVDLPAVPSFDLPPTNPDGSHSVKEMRVKGRKMFETEVSIKGIVTWVYDCPTAIRKPGWTDADTMKAIEEDPTKCELPKFYLGDTADAPVEKSIWVVDVPRPPYKLEKDRLPKEDIKNWPAVPPYKVGDEMIVTGKWTQSSPHSERNVEGLLVHVKLNNVTQGWETPPPNPAATVPGALPPATKAPPKVR